MGSEATKLHTRLVPAAWRPPANDPEARRQLRLQLWFYVGVPLLLGFMLGWLKVGRAGAWPPEIALLYWVVVSFATTWLTALATRPVAYLLRPVRAPLWLALVVGQLVAGWLLVLPFARVWVEVVNGLVPPAAAAAPVTSTFVDFIKRWPSNAVLWVGLNLAFHYGLRMPRFGYLPPGGTGGDAAAVPSAAVAPASADAAAVPPTGAAPTRTTFTERVRPERRGALLALRAEGHYLRVYTDAGNDLILYRLSDAIDEIPAAEGAQVHRSWWVAARAVGTERHPDRLVLTNGLHVPVSRSFRVVARDRGLLR